MSNFEILPFPPERRVVVDSGYLAAHRHLIYGFLEVDITQARQILRDRSDQEGNRLSFTAFLVASLARAIKSIPKVQAYRDWRGRLVVFHDVDVVTMIEPEPGAVAIPHIIRNAENKSVSEITAEIRHVQSNPNASEQRGSLYKLGIRAPRPLRLLFFKLVKKNPHWMKRYQGTVVITSVGMFGKGGGWGLAFLPVHTLGFTIGGIAQKPGVNEGKISIREYLNLTISFDHDIVDGAPAARFAKKFVDLLENASALTEVH
ncbi:MAG: 2-oxo acid dehydrogenase subunit E2 [Anaerolineales bacterium]|nr:MAG: 2-oxo acid dehydrogenase subunit E2 [Anaerolineales bacterium]